MTEAEMREKVIKGLSACMPQTEADASIGCDGCPYNGHPCGGDYQDNDHVNLPIRMIEDIRALLKAQEPRVMTLEEVLALKPDTPVYMQHKSGECGWDIYRGIEDDITCDIVTGSLWAQGEYWYQKEYGKSFVFWTSCPSDEVKGMTPWN